MQGVTRAACANYLIGDASNRIVSLETTPAQVSPLRAQGFVAHTNSFNADGEFCARQERFEDALRSWIQLGAGRLSAAALQASFRVPGVQFPVVSSPAGVETIHTIVLNLSQRRLLVSEGARAEDFVCYPLG